MYYFALLFKFQELQLLFVSDILQSSLAVYYIGFSQNVHRKSDLLHEEVKLSSITALPCQSDT